MKIVVDLHNCLLDVPKFFFQLGELAIVSGTPEHKREAIKRLLKSHKINYKKLILCPLRWHKGDTEVYLKSKKWKVSAVVNEKPDVFF